jgi:Flp pilus assembly protein TadD
MGGMVEQALREAVEHRQAGRTEDAEAALQRVLQQAPEEPRALEEMGIVKFMSGRSAEAAGFFERAARVEPNRAAHFCNLGLSLARLGKYEEAIANYRKAIEIQQNFLEAHFNLALTLRQVDQAEASIDVWKRVIELKPNFGEAYQTLGWELYFLGNLVEARKILAHGLERWPQDSQMRWAMSWCCLAGGDWIEGWKQMEYRWVNRDPSLPRHNIRQPMWNGEELNGRRILIHPEGGFGDTIHFSRYAPLVVARGGRVILVAQPTLVELMRSVPGVEEVIASDRGDVPEFKVHCPMFSLPRLLGTTLENVPAEIPYLLADGGRSGTWRRRVWVQGPERRIGLVWAGLPGKRTDAMRSIPFSKLDPLGRVEGNRFFSLQKGEASREAAGQNGLALTDWTEELKDWSDTAALVNNLDLVITVDTAVAHLAGAMGKAVWMMMPPVNDWRWMLDRTDSPWYPTMKIFRQKKRGDWCGVIDEVAMELRGL